MKKIMLALFTLCCAALNLAQAQCNAQFTWTPSPLNNNLLRVSFINTSTYSLPSIVDKTIYYGDGSPTQGFYSGQTHTYAAPGTYTVIVGINTVDSLTQIACHDSVTSTITVAYPTCGATIASVNNGGGSYTFTANNPAGTSGLSYSWNFGDGYTGSGSTVNHTYNTSGFYNVSLQVTGTGCTYTNNTSIHYVDSTVICDSLEADFNASVNGLNVTFNNTSTYLSVFYYLNIANTSHWIFGDGATSNSNSPIHNYSGPGTYTVTLINSWVDSTTQNVYCVDSSIQQVTVTTPAPPNYISGTIHWDPNAISDSVYNFKVWLITHDNSANTLTAVDSTDVYPWVNNYSFGNKPAGNYLIKAAPFYASVSLPAYGYVPTYHDSSLYWSSASTVAHSGGSTGGKDIWMRLGVPTTGPGFIGGNISAGAGKGTGTGIEGLLVFLRNEADGKLIASSYTDANGDYSFDNIATGTYNVYPEAMNYTTTPSTVLTITNGQATSNDNDFVQTEDEIKPASVLSITEIGEKDGIKVYPNPVTDRLFIENKNGAFNQVSVINTLGQVVKQSSIKKGNNVIDMTTFGSGMYYVIINGTEGARSVKVTKK